MNKPRRVLCVVIATLNPNKRHCNYKTPKKRSCSACCFSEYCSLKLSVSEDLHQEVISTDQEIFHCSSGLVRSKTRSLRLSAHLSSLCGVLHPSPTRHPRHPHHDVNLGGHMIHGRGGDGKYSDDRVVRWGAGRGNYSDVLKMI